MKTKKLLLIIASVLAALTLTGCFGHSADDTTAETTAPVPNDTVSDTIASEETTYFTVSHNGTYFEYKLFNKDGSVAEEMTDCIAEPYISLTDGDLIKVSLDGETYYYDLDRRIFSESFKNVRDENGTLAVLTEKGKIIICDIFDEDGFYTEIDEFSFSLTHSADSPFVSVEFIDDGGSVKAIYLSGNEKDEIIECFNITDKTRFVTVSDWINKKDLIEPSERDAVENFLFGYMGKTDYNTGLEIVYEISGAITVNKTRYYHCECFFLMEKEDGTTQRVPAAEFLLSEDKTLRYDCRDSDGELIVYTENNMI